MTYKFPAGGEGGGAEAFTDLTDAPATIAPNAFILGNTDGTALRSAAWVTNDDDGTRCLITIAESGASAQSGWIAASEDRTSQVSIRATQNQVICELVNQIAGGGRYCNFTTSLEQGVALLYKDSLDTQFELYNFDVPATDATATMTVDAVEYSLAKAIPVKIGSDTYFWPLFGPVAP
jgi:hypothetical protein